MTDNWSELLSPPHYKDKWALLGTLIFRRDSLNSSLPKKLSADPASPSVCPGWCRVSRRLQTVNTSLPRFSQEVFHGDTQPWVSWLQYVPAQLLASLRWTGSAPHWLSQGRFSLSHSHGQQVGSLGGWRFESLQEAALAFLSPAPCISSSITGRPQPFSLIFMPLWTKNHFGRSERKVRNGLSGIY